MRDFLGLIMRGFVIGSADLVPGVSGGTMAFILGIYERLMQALKSLSSDALYHFVTLKWQLVKEEVDFKTLFGVGLGVLFALFFFTRIIPLPEWVAVYKPQFYGFFFGMVFATVIVFLTQQKSAKFMRLLTLLIGTAVGLILTSLELSAIPDTRPFVFLSGFIAISAMLLPGISGSYLLLMLGKYELMLNAIASLHWPTLGLFMAGAFIGMLIFVRAITWLLSRYHDTVLMFITGLIAGTLPQLWPLSHMTRPSAEELGMVGLCTLAGVVVISLLHWLQVRLSD